jgi:anti-sigma B factor antagonist
MFEIEHVGDVAILTPNQSIDGKGAAEASRVVDSVLDKGTSELCFNLSKLEYVDSSGLGMLVTSLRKCRDVGGSVSLFGLSENVYTVFEVTMLHEVFNIADDRESALAAHR